jgi:hypothetical protein
MPYRVHLAVHVLKDTLIIFFLLNFLSQKKISWLLNAFFITGLRLFSIAYLSVFVKKKYFYLGGLIVFISAVYLSEELIALLEATNEVDMAFREFDNVPNFSAYGLFGVLLRAFLWPLFAFSGVYIFLSPSLGFAPLALGSIAISIASYLLFKRPPINLQALMVFAIVALLTTGFTTYIRYCFPLLVLIPLLRFHEFAQNTSYNKKS